MGAYAIAQDTIAPPLITSVKQDLGNDELWYIGGTSATPEAEVIIYLQSENGNTLGFNVKADKNGKWFYKHGEFLKEGSYKSWVQLKIDGAFSSPSQEVSFKVIHTAFGIGAFRISYSTMYLTASAILFLALVTSGVLGFYHLRDE